MSTLLKRRNNLHNCRAINVKEMDKEVILEMAYEAMTKVEFLKTIEEKRMYLAALCDAMSWGLTGTDRRKNIQKTY